MSDIIIYGATGYMGKQFTKALLAKGIRPILAGRSKTVQTMAQGLGLESRIFGLDDAQATAHGLRNARLLVNLAGPFAQTVDALIEACLQSACHYLDIAGEVSELQRAYRYAERSEQAGIMLLPAAGFGVVPTDLAAHKAATLLAGADNLRICYATRGGASRGTLQTVLRDIHSEGFQRIDGKLRSARPAQSSASFSVLGQTFTAVYNPWRADLFSAALSTGIGNIQTYSVFPGLVVGMMQGKWLWLRDLLLKYALPLLPEGPNDKQLAAGSTFVQARASNANASRTVSLKGPEAYQFTTLCLTQISFRILKGQFKPGFQTPSSFAPDLLDAMEGVEWQIDPA